MQNTMDDTGQGEPGSVFDRPVFDWSIFDLKTANGAYSPPVMHSASLQTFMKMLFVFFDSPVGKASYMVVAEQIGADGSERLSIEPEYFVYHVAGARCMPIRNAMTIGFVIFIIECIVGKAGIVNKANRLLYEFDEGRGMTQWNRDEELYERRFEKLNPRWTVSGPKTSGTPSIDEQGLICRYILKMTSDSDIVRHLAVDMISPYVRHHPASDHVLASAVGDRNPIIRNAASKVFADYLKYYVDDAKICHDLTAADLMSQLSRLAGTGIKKLYIIGCEFAPDTQ
jgi:hypothetical protein